MPERFECEVLQKRALHYIHLPTYIPNNAAGVLKDFQCALYVCLQLCDIQCTGVESYRNHTSGCRHCKVMGYLAILGLLACRGDRNAVYGDVSWHIITRVHLMNAELCQAAANPQTNPVDLGCESVCRLQ